MTTRSAIVGANNSCASCSAPAWPRSMKITCRPDNSAVSGPNMGCSEVTRQPAFTSASSPARSGVFSEPRSKIRLRGARCARNSRRRVVTLKGVASTIKSKSSGSLCQSSMTSKPGSPPVGSAMATRNPWEARKSANQPPILPPPPITRARLPLPCAWAATRACSWVAREDCMSCRSNDSARSGDTPRRAAALRPRNITSRSRPKSRVARPVARLTAATCSLKA